MNNNVPGKTFLTIEAHGRKWGGLEAQLLWPVQSLPELKKKHVPLFWGRGAQLRPTLTKIVCRKLSETRQRRTRVYELALYVHPISRYLQAAWHKSRNSARGMCTSLHRVIPYCVYRYKHHVPTAAATTRSVHTFFRTMYSYCACALRPTASVFVTCTQHSTVHTLYICTRIPISE